MPPPASVSDDEDESNTRGTGTAPPLNAYKVDFLKRRWTQTVLGGLELRLRGTVPRGVYALQFGLWLLPPLLSIPFTVYVELNYSFETQWVAQVIYGALVGLLVLGLQVVALRKRAVVSPDAAALELGPTFDEEEEYEFDGSCVPGVWALLVPRASLPAVLTRIVLSALMCGYALGYLLPSRINAVYGYDALHTRLPRCRARRCGLCNLPRFRACRRPTRAVIVDGAGGGG
eukprot:TRINITY_DN1068_c0_g6_i1.p1 TRINITY_DN1068_c0_g6~~TRINITY_DN1068_c0_g6_i1.p1  ORF type:complete len:231 (-),score=67.49 TRINITY_DN1068_c0_g6_i1:38-730(-)